MAYKRLNAAEKFKTLPSKYTEQVTSWDLDWRSPIGQQVMARLLTLAQDLGGWDELSRMEQILVERATFLSMRVSEYETAKLGGKIADLDDGQYSASVNVLQGIIAKLGLKRRAIRGTSLQEFLAKGAGQ